MSLFEAQILVGQPHRYQGGIRATHQLFLAGKGKTIWFLFPILEDGRAPEMIRWSVTDDLIPDALLMIAYHVVREEGLVREGAAVLPNGGGDWTDLKEVSADHLRLLRQNAVAALRHIKLVVTVCEDSMLRSQLLHFANTEMELEVCVPSYSRLQESMTGKVVERGNLLA